MPSAERQERRLKIIACRAIYTGRNQATGHEFTIFEVDAAREDGRLVNEKLRSFKALPIGQVIDVTIEPFISEKHGKSFTIHPKQSTSPSGTGQLNEALKVLEEVKAAFARLEKRVATLEARSGAPPTVETRAAASDVW